MVSWPISRCGSVYRCTKLMGLTSWLLLPLWGFQEVRPTISSWFKSCWSLDYQQYLVCRWWLEDDSWVQHQDFRLAWAEIWNLISSWEDAKGSSKALVERDQSLRIGYLDSRISIWPATPWLVGQPPHRPLWALSLLETYRYPPGLLRLTRAEPVKWRIPQELVRWLT